MAQLFTNLLTTVMDASGNPVSGGKVYFYTTGTSTLATVYSDSALTTPRTNPVVADASGRIADTYLSSAVTYRVKMTDADDVTIRDTDPYDFGGTGDADLTAEFATKLDVDGGNVGANAAALRTALGATTSGDLFFTSNLTMAANRLVYSSSSNVLATATITSQGRSLVAASDAATASAVLAIYDTALGHTAATAFAAGAPLIVREDTVLEMDFTGHTSTDTAQGLRLKAYTDWLATCVIAGGKLKLTLAAGTKITPSGMKLAPTRNMPPLHFACATSAWSLTISAITFTNVSGADYTVHIEVDEAIDASVTAGWVVWARNVNGNNDARAATNTYLITSIDVDRMGFVADLRWAKSGALTSPTTIDTASTFLSVASSELVIPRACIVPQDGWAGGSDEGWINAGDGGVVWLENIGIGYGDDGSDAEQDLVFIGRDAYCRLSGAVLAGAGASAAVLRCARATQVDVIQSGIGCAGVAGSAISLELGTPFSSERSDAGGGVTQCVVVNNSPSFTPSGLSVVGGTVGIQADLGTKCTMANTRIWGSTRGTYAIGGSEFFMYSTTWIDNCTIGADVLRGQYSGTEPTFGGVTANGANYPTGARSGVTFRDGAYNWSTTIPVVTGGIAVSIANNATQRSALTGDGGACIIAGETSASADHAALLQILVTTAESATAISLGADVVVDNTDPSAWSNVGKTTVGVWETGGTVYLYIKNERGGTTGYRVFPMGDWTMAAFAAA